MEEILHQLILEKIPFSLGFIDNKWLAGFLPSTVLLCGTLPYVNSISINYVCTATVFSQINLSVPFNPIMHQPQPQMYSSQHWVTVVSQNRRGSLEYVQPSTSVCVISICDRGLVYPFGKRWFIPTWLLSNYIFVLFAQKRWLCTWSHTVLGWSLMTSFLVQHKHTWYDLPRSPNRQGEPPWIRMVQFSIKGRPRHAWRTGSWGCIFWGGSDDPQML